MAMAGLYRRVLPSPPAIDFASTEGKQLFLEAVQSGTMEGFFKLISYIQTQSEPAYCVLASLAMVLNALAALQGRKWKGPWRWFDESMLDCCEPLEKVKAKGISFGKVVCLAHCAGVRWLLRWFQVASEMVMVPAMAVMLVVVLLAMGGLDLRLSVIVRLEYHETLGGFKDYDMLLGPTGRSNLSISVYGIEIIIIYWESWMFIIELGITVQLAIVDFRGIVDPEVALDYIIFAFHETSSMWGCGSDNLRESVVVVGNFLVNPARAKDIGLVSPPPLSSACHVDTRLGYLVEWPLNGVGVTGVQGTWGIVDPEIALGAQSCLIIAVGELKLWVILFSVLVSSFIVEDMYYCWSTSCSIAAPCRGSKGLLDSCYIDSDVPLREVDDSLFEGSVCRPFLWGCSVAQCEDFLFSNSCCLIFHYFD
ncbi:hypothetical protein F0562_011677 [Nyssa sinensis]|uniref:glutathione gamma-glutamylcysteinyltransferase n=1 Tax=Nyssa sinensis TaxID=561372 RepID=A0A5J4ZQQ9_9ASTE|nr:hypothetical protein F0562_011677 [Nyssa sinensis]